MLIIQGYLGNVSNRNFEYNSCAVFLIIRQSGVTQEGVAEATKTEIARNAKKMY